MTLVFRAEAFGTLKDPHDLGCPQYAVKRVQGRVQGVLPFSHGRGRVLLHGRSSENTTYVVAYMLGKC